jgi:hypothetical protein
MVDSGHHLPNYRPPPKHSWGRAFQIAGVGFWNLLKTPLGFIVIVYCLNVVAWGGMLFLLLLNAAPAMDHPSSNDINSPRRKWIEIDSQILTGLFCVTAFGLIPWRFKELYFILQYRLFGKQEYLRKLAGIYRGWFRLPGSDALEVPHLEDYPPTQATLERIETKREQSEALDLENPALPLPLSLAPDIPLTGVRASPTSIWKLDFVIWCMAWNTFFQIVLCVFMWKYNRRNRPSWATGLFVALGCIIAGVGGLMGWWEGRRVKQIEGVPWDTADLLMDAEKEFSKTEV